MSAAVPPAPGRPWWTQTTVSQLVARHARDSPDRLAFISGERRVTWPDYDAAADRAAARLQVCGLVRGDRVAILLPDGPDVHAWYVGAERAGLVVVGIGPRAGRAEMAHLLSRSAARGLVTPPVLAGVPASELIRELAGGGRAGGRHVVTEEGDLGHGPTPSRRRPGEPLSSQDLFLLNSTSGTTGLPKCVMHNQSRWLYFHELAAEAGRLTAADVFMSLLPTPFGFGLWTAHFTPAVLGAPLVLLPRFGPEAAIRAVAEHGVTVMACVTTQFVMMLNSPAIETADLHALRVMFTGGESVPYERALEFETKTGARVLQFYGSNETGALSRTTLEDPAPRRLRTAGRVIPAMRVRLLDGETDVTASGGPGEPVCRGPATSLGYWDDPEANAQLMTSDGWMRTGDLAELDPAGYLRIVGRLSDIIIRGGKNISAAQVEEAVGRCREVAMAAAVAMPDPTFGERVCVFVVLHEGYSLDLEGLTGQLDGAGVGKELWPERLEVVDELPRSSGGKVAKGELRRRLASL